MLTTSRMLLRSARARLASTSAKIIYTECDEAPMLATYSLLPVINAFATKCNVVVEKSDISLSGRIIAHFPERLTAEQRIEDELAKLGELACTPEANIIKLPNISASVPQLQEAISELQAKGYDLPNYVQEPSTDAEREAHATYAKVLGSAVNPVLREGNSDRRVAPPVKAYAAKNPHKMGDWSPDCKTHVAHMTDGDFFSSEQSHIMPAAGTVSIEHVGADGSTTVLKAETTLQAGEVIDAATMNKKALCAFFDREIAAAKDEGIMVSLHMKATMMKVSDPIMFGHCVTTYYKDAFAKHAALFEELGVNPNNGIGDVYERIAGHPQQAEVEADLMATYETQPKLAMVNSHKGITNLHVPSDVIIDASMPVVARDSGKMWNTEDALEDTKALIPDRCYATFYDEVLNYQRENGQFDVTTMGNVSNVGLMAQKAEEYGSHDKTFEIPAAGTVLVKDQDGQVIFEHAVGEGDIWRMCQTKDAPIRDWVRLAVERARATGDTALFWLTEERAHDRSIIAKVDEYIKEHDTSGLDIRIKPPVAAVRESMERATAGKNTISVTGNVLRDYLTDLFPILELGTSAKMLSIVPLLAGGGLYETGAGGSAPKHVQQFVEEGHLRWDSLGEFLALAVSLESLGEKSGNANATMLGKALMDGTGMLLDEGKSPKRKVNELDNRGSHFYLAQFWADALANQTDNAEVAAVFGPLAAELKENEATILAEIDATQGQPMDIGGYYRPDPVKAEATMRPSTTFNGILERFAAL